jgi:beta-N-acetylglucosaminidase
VGLNLLSNSKSSDWKSKEEGAYNALTDSYIPFDGSTWVTASEKAVKYYMDPRNFLTEDAIFQFESLEYQEEEQTKSGVENILKNTPMYKTEYSYTDDSGKESTITYSQTFMEAAVSSGVSPYHLASRVKQEVVTGPTSMSTSVSGTVKGFEGIYNFYNIGANNSTKAGGAVANGLAWANKDTTYLRPWNTIYKAIVGGAQYLGSNYINVGQNTLYLQKFNVTSGNTYNHQYMSNIEAPASEALKTATAYGEDKADMSIVFSIPVYYGMPSQVCPEPSGESTNPNNYLKSLKVKGYSFRTPFQTGDDGSTVYSLTVARKVSSVKINATPVSSVATVTGTGSKKLKLGTKTYTVKVKAQSGSVRKYKIKITRKKK